MMLDYAAVGDLVALLERSGYAGDASTIRSALQGGATGTEILMALRFHLRDIVRRMPPGDGQALASSLLVDVNRALDGVQ